MGASTAFAGNFLLRKNLIVPNIPALLFMLDTGTAAGVSAIRALMNAYNIIAAQCHQFFEEILSLARLFYYQPTS